jgi:hypothetical protein
MARIWPSWATHSLQIHTATIAEVLGSMVRRFAWKSTGTCSQDLPQNWQRIEAGSSGSGEVGCFSSSTCRYASSSLIA